MTKSGQFTAKDAGVVFEHADIDGNGRNSEIEYRITVWLLVR